MLCLLVKISVLFHTDHYSYNNIDLYYYTYIYSLDCIHNDMTTKEFLLHVVTILRQKKHPLQRFCPVLIQLVLIISIRDQYVRGFKALLYFKFQAAYMSVYINSQTHGCYLLPMFPPTHTINPGNLVLRVIQAISSITSTMLRPTNLKTTILIR